MPGRNTHLVNQMTSATRSEYRGRELPPAITKEIGLRIRLLREEHDPPMSQTEAAAAMGISQSALSGLEAGRKCPSLATLLRLQLTFGLATIEEILGELPSRALSERLLRQPP